MNRAARDAAYRRLILGAIAAAATGPRRRDRYSLKASISHDALAEIRAGLDGLGIDWRTAGGHPPKKETTE